MLTKHMDNGEPMPKRNIKNVSCENDSISEIQSLEAVFPSLNLYIRNLVS